MLNKLGHTAARAAAQHYLSDNFLEDHVDFKERNQTLREVKDFGVRKLSNPLRDKDEAVMLVERYGVSEKYAQQTIVELHEQAAVLQMQTDYRHDLQDIRGMMTVNLADPQGPCMKYWKPKKGTIVVLMVRYMHQRLTETASIVSAPIVRHGRDTEQKKLYIRAAGLAALNYEELAEVLDERNVEDSTGSEWVEYLALADRANRERLTDQLKECLPMLFFRMEKGRKPRDWFQHRRDMKGTIFTRVNVDRLLKGLPELKLKAVKDLAPNAEVRERSIRAGFRLWYRRAKGLGTWVPEIPETVMEESIKSVIRWRDTGVDSGSDAGSSE